MVAAISLVLPDLSIDVAATLFQCMGATNGSLKAKVVSLTTSPTAMVEDIGFSRATKILSNAQALDGNLFSSVAKAPYAVINYSLPLL